MTQPWRGPERERIHLVQGEHLVSEDPRVVVTTILGSCVAACVRDPQAGVGGINHFLLPGNAGDAGARGHGVHAMELLINEMLRRGASKRRMEARLFGGARMLRGVTDIGEKNRIFAEQFLRDEGIACIGGSLGGERARRIEFAPVSGRTRQLLVSDGSTSVFSQEIAVPPPQPSFGSVELF